MKKAATAVISSIDVFSLSIGNVKCHSVSDEIGKTTLAYSGNLRLWEGAKP
jgi:hypothetical protein